MEKKEILIKETPTFKFKVRQWQAINPKNLNAIQLVQECLDDKGNVEFESTRNYLLSNEEVLKLAEGLKELIKNE